MSDKIKVIHADCREAIKGLADCSVDSCVTDGPYALVSIVKRFGGKNAAPCKEGTDGVYRRASAGFMGKAWDTGETYFDPDFWREMYRVLKPGAHVVAFAGTRTYHRLACAIEDAGFEIRDQIGWLYGSGFPKSHDVSKGIDKALGRERTKIRIAASQVRNPKTAGGGRDGTEGASRPFIESAKVRGFHEAVSDEAVSDEAVSDEAVEWRGWGTALKPAWEPVCLARKPLDGTVAANVLLHKTGAINIDASRIGVIGGTSKSTSKSTTTSVGGYLNAKAGEPIDAGRWPANVIHDGSDEVVEAFPESDSSASSNYVAEPNYKNKVFGKGMGGNVSPTNQHTDGGSAARFFYTAKADGDDRLGSGHPTVKPVDLMQYLVRLVTPRGGLVLDPFSGTGTTGEAAFREGMRCILIEREADYVKDIERRISLLMAGPDERARASVKAKIEAGRLKDDAGPLFSKVAAE